MVDRAVIKGFPCSLEQIHSTLCTLAMLFTLGGGWRGVQWRWGKIQEVFLQDSDQNEKHINKSPWDRNNPVNGISALAPTPRLPTDEISIPSQPKWDAGPRHGEYAVPWLPNNQIEYWPMLLKQEVTLEAVGGIGVPVQNDRRFGQGRVNKCLHPALAHNHPSH